MPNIRIRFRGRLNIGGQISAPWSWYLQAQAIERAVGKQQSDWQVGVFLGDFDVHVNHVVALLLDTCNMWGRLTRAGREPHVGPGTVVKRASHLSVS